LHELRNSSQFPETAAMPDNTPFFVVGAGRSGTTLLRLILAGHPRLHIPPETRFILTLVRELPLAESLTPAQVDCAVAVMTEDYRWPDMEMSAEHLRREAASLQTPRLVDIINIVYHQQLVRANKGRFGDKTPGYIEIVPQLATLYPGAKFIHLIRDGRDVAISCIDLDWERYYERDRFEWTLAMTKRQEYLHSSYARQVLEVRYEDLVSNLEVTVRRICAFLGEDFEPAMLDWRGRIPLVPARERRIHGKLGRPASSDAIAAWRRKLSALECFAIEACLYRDLQQLDYPLRFHSVLWRPLLSAVGWLLATLAPALRLGIPYLQRRQLLPKRLYI
jgi:Sulfotransferase family